MGQIPGRFLPNPHSRQQSIHFSINECIDRLSFLTAPRTLPRISKGNRTSNLTKSITISYYNRTTWSRGDGCRLPPDYWESGGFSFSYSRIASSIIHIIWPLIVRCWLLAYSLNTACTSSGHLKDTFFTFSTYLIYTIPVIYAITFLIKTSLRGWQHVSNVLYLGYD